MAHLVRQGLVASALRRARALAALAAVSAAAATAAGTACAVPAHAVKREADPLSAAPAVTAPDAGPVRDTLLDARLRSGGVASAAAAEGMYRDADGHAVRVRVSDAYSNPDDAAQEAVDFLGTLLHGDEMSRLGALLVTPREIRRICGAGALACYSPLDEEMVISGEDGRPGHPPRQLVIAHEYGHHLAENRLNKPWSALDRGTKRWSTYEGICRGIKRGRIRPGSFFENPGEAFAEAFAFNRFPRLIAWQWDIARPDQGSFDAIFADVTSPWTRRTSDGWSGRLDRGDRRRARVFRTPLDGRLRVELDGPSGADFDLVLRASGSRRVLKRSAGRRADERLGFTVCGKRRVRVEVRRSRGFGSFEVTTARP